MSDALTPQQLQPAPSSAPGAPVLELTEIQGDILIGLQKNFERFLFFQITDVAAFKSALRKKIAHRITNTQTVFARERQLRDNKAHGHATLPLVGLNVGFTTTGINKLVPAVAPDLGDPSFGTGAAKRAAAMGDPMDAPDKPKWLPPFVLGNIDGVFLITGGTQEAVDGEAAKILGILGASVTSIFDQTGNARPGAERGHEHFGWLDGVSQPGVKGLTTPFPGQRLIDPGKFVFGYPGQEKDPPFAWMRNGSFMVFRRLNQLVPEFEQFILDSAASLGMDPVLLGARVVGRWKSGAPMALTPMQDDTTMGGDPQRNNNFDFSDDQAQRRCPFAAHIRKTNPRADFPAPLTQENAVDTRRIMRAGIPFGPEVDPGEDAAHKTSAERGLMFVCYQTSIVDQFEFVQTQWANPAGFMFGKKHPDGTPVTVGEDPLIGQNPAGDRSRTIDEPVPNYPTGNVRSSLKIPQDFVVPTGGAYFFVPSATALADELSA